MKKLVKSNKAATNTVRAFGGCSCSCSSCQKNNWGQNVGNAKKGHKDMANLGY